MVVFTVRKLNQPKNKKMNIGNKAPSMIFRKIFCLNSF